MQVAPQKEPFFCHPRAVREEPRPHAQFCVLLKNFSSDDIVELSGGYRVEWLQGRVIGIGLRFKLLQPREIPLGVAGGTYDSHSLHSDNCLGRISGEAYY